MFQRSVKILFRHSSKIVSQRCHRFYQKKNADVKNYFLRRQIMTDTLDVFIQELQEEIFEDTKATFGEIAYQRWRKPLYMGAIKDPDGYAKAKGKCGNIEIFLRFEKEQVIKASFQTDGCGSDIVCGSFAAEMAMGKTPEEILNVSGKNILEKMREFPKENAPAAFHAVKTLHQAARAYKGFKG